MQNCNTFAIVSCKSEWGLNYSECRLFLLKLPQCDLCGSHYGVKTLFSLSASCLKIFQFSSSVLQTSCSFERKVLADVVITGEYFLCGIKEIISIQ